MTENKDVNQKNVSDNQEEVDLSKRQFIKTAGMTTGGIVGGILLGSFISKPFKTEKYEPASEDSHHHGSGGHNTFTEAMQFFTRIEDLLTLSQRQKSYSRRMKMAPEQLLWAHPIILISS